MIYRYFLFLATLFICVAFNLSAMDNSDDRGDQLSPSRSLGFPADHDEAAAPTSVLEAAASFYRTGSLTSLPPLDGDDDVRDNRHSVPPQDIVSHTIYFRGLPPCDAPYWRERYQAVPSRQLRMAGDALTDFPDRELLFDFARFVGIWAKSVGYDPRSIAAFPVGSILFPERDDRMFSPELLTLFLRAVKDTLPLELQSSSLFEEKNTQRLFELFREVASLFPQPSLAIEGIIPTVYGEKGPLSFSLVTPNWFHILFTHHAGPYAQNEYARDLRQALIRMELTILYRQKQKYVWGCFERWLSAWNQTTATSIDDPVWKDHLSLMGSNLKVLVCLSEFFRFPLFHTRLKFLQDGFNMGLPVVETTRESYLHLMAQDLEVYRMTVLKIKTEEYAPLDFMPTYDAAPFPFEYWKQMLAVLQREQEYQGLAAEMKRQAEALQEREAALEASRGDLFKREANMRESAEEEQQRLLQEEATEKAQQAREKAAQKERDQQRTQLNALKGEKRQQAAEIRNLRQTVATLEAQHKALEQSLVDAKRQLAAPPKSPIVSPEQLSRQEGENKRLKSDLQKAQQEVQQQKAALQKMQAEREAQEKRFEEAAALQAQKDKTLEQELAQLRDVLKRSQNDVSSLRGEYNEAVLVRDEMASQVEPLKQRDLQRENELQVLRQRLIAAEENRSLWEAYAREQEARALDPRVTTLTGPVMLVPLPQSSYGANFPQQIPPQYFVASAHQETYRGRGRGRGTSFLPPSYGWMPPAVAALSPASTVPSTEAITSVTATVTPAAGAAVLSAVASPQAGSAAAPRPQSSLLPSEGAHAPPAA